MSKVRPGLPLVTARVKDPEDAVRVLNRLQPALQLLSKLVNFGPMPGAYFPFTFGVEAMQGTLMWETTLDVTLDGASETNVLVDAVTLDMGSTGSLRITLDSGVIRTQPYNARTIKNFTMTSTQDYSDPDDATSGATVLIDLPKFHDPMLADTGVDGQLSLVEFQPIALTVWLDTGDVTIDINADGTSILSSPLSSSSSSASLTSKGDFVDGKVPRGAELTLDIDSIDSGTPTKLRVVLWASQLGDIFDA